MAMKKQNKWILDHVAYDFAHWNNGFLNIYAILQ